jgi:hypothetical protein
MRGRVIRIEGGSLRKRLILTAVRGSRNPQWLGCRRFRGRLQAILALTYFVETFWLIST